MFYWKQVQTEESCSEQWLAKSILIRLQIFKATSKPEPFLIPFNYVFRSKWHPELLSCLLNPLSHLLSEQMHLRFTKRPKWLPLSVSALRELQLCPSTSWIPGLTGSLQNLGVTLCKSTLHSDQPERSLGLFLCGASDVPPLGVLNQAF